MKIFRSNLSLSLQRKFIFFLISVLFFTSCNKDTVDISSKSTERYEADHLLKYYDQLCKFVKTTPGFFPPQAARAYGYVSIAQYEAVIHGIENGISLQNQLNGLAYYTLPQPVADKEYNWAIASNAATHKMIKYMFGSKLSPANILSVDSLYKVTLDNLSATADQNVVTRSTEFGVKIADVMYDYSKTDGGHESYIDPFQLPYTVPSDEHCWVPTSTVKTPLSPKWGTNRPFLINNIAKVQPVMPVTFSTDQNSEFFREAMFVYNTVKNNTSEQVEIAKYWADDPFATCTPTGHTFNILRQILESERVTLSKASVAFARMGIAENDAFIACWKGKYDYVLIRPISYIQKYIDPNFKTVIGTPPFPAYTSGHSCEMGAGARIFTDLFTNGNGDYPFTDYTQLQFGYKARNFQNFDQMASECANSRLYGGIHYVFDNSKGLVVGKAIGDNVNTEIKWPIFVR
ncbi:MAG: vanadium-dependent haloperoxidase [Saprospiraceae bacterium]